MSSDKNIWGRHQNKKALERKARAKARHFGSGTESEVPNAQLNAGGETVIYSGSTEDHRLLAWKGESLLVCRTASTLPKSFSQSLVIGDALKVNVEGDQPEVVGWLPRKSFLARMRGDASRRSDAGWKPHVIAANIDVAVIVAALRDPPFHPRFVDRYLILCQNGNVLPIICLNKADLAEPPRDQVVIYQNLGIPILNTSTTTGLGVEDLKLLLKGKQSVLVGNSGVGKSSLINLFVPAASAAVSHISEKSRRGRHTTTSSAMYCWARNSYLIDTPGIRSLGIGEIPKDEIKYYFPEFQVDRSPIGFHPKNIEVPPPGLIVFSA